MFNKIDEINKYAWELIPVIVFTATAWDGAQKIMVSLFALWFPNFNGLPLGILEIIIATIGLYWILKSKKE